jgi:hypothetical protein
MEKIIKTSKNIDQFRVAVVPKGILNNFVIKKGFSCISCFVLAIVLILPLTVFPGLILFVAPAEVAVLGKIHDEVQLIQWVRRHTIIREGRWEDTESEKDLAFSKSPERRDSTIGYIR